MAGIMEEAGYNITNKEFKQISKWAENVYNIAVIVDCFVSNQPEIEECYNLAPVIKNLRQNADLLKLHFLPLKSLQTGYSTESSKLNAER